MGFISKQRSKQRIFERFVASLIHPNDGVEITIRTIVLMVI